MDTVGVQTGGSHRSEKVDRVAQFPDWLIRALKQLLNDEPDGRRAKQRTFHFSFG
jgi:hypothetical protein